MIESQYIDDYIDSGYTIGTFLAYRLRGRAKRYSDVYARALQRAVNRRIVAGRVIAGRSVGGRTAYYSDVASMRRVLGDA